ncbi:MAG: ABC transporter ATP-binding protein [Pseudomonadota bacterium]
MAIHFNDVSFSYPGSSRQSILSIPDWVVNDGEQVFVHGPSGCGKSTLLNLLSGFFKPSTGSLEVFGQNLGNMSPRQRDRFRTHNIGYVFQQYNLIPYLSAIENVQLAAYFSKSGIGTQPILEMLGLLQLPATEHHKPVRNLSVGQQQRIAIARALINQPKLILADEPTSSLDQANRDAFISLLLKIAQEKTMTVIFVSHDLSLSHHFATAKAMDQISRSTN